MMKERIFSGNIVAMLLVLCFAYIAFGDTVNCPVTADATVVADSEIPTVLESDYAIIWLNQYECSYASSILGLDYWESGNYLEFVDGYGSTNRRVYECNPNTGAYHTHLDCTYILSGYEWPYGVCIGYMTNMVTITDTVEDNVWAYYGGSWGSLPDPAGTASKGIDYDGTYYWETYNSVIKRWLPSSPGAAITISSPSTTGMLAGLTVFTPYNGGTGIAVCEHGNPYTMAFYKVEGSSLTPMHTITWSGLSGSRGLAYSESRGTFFWSYVSTGGTPYIAEFWCPDATTLDQDTWAGIKAEF